MPTPVSTARQCLTKEAEQALDEAVTVARRRGHGQTTSLHMVSSLLSLPSSALREACSRTRNNAYSTRIQFKALELSLGVSLDRLPSSPNRVEEPPVSNSLMAAIKRSQANQRRQPENFNFYQQQQQLLSSSSSSSSVTVVRVELQNLILSILDDPVVSRVFGEAGFRSCEIKIQILRPVHQLFRYSRYKAPPMFLCNLNSDNELGRRGFSFPFMGFSGVLDGEDNFRRIGEVMMRDEGNGRRNPLLVGACARDSLRSFLEMVQRRRGTSVLPVELSGLGVICVEDEIFRFVSGNCEEGLMKLRFEEVGRMVENCVGPGVVVNFGDLKALTADDSSSVDTLRCVVRQIAWLLEVHGRKVWLIGAAARYETYLKFLNIFPSIEKDCDLQLLPITTLRLSMAESFPRSSLMDSFVPFGGFFSTPDVKSTLRSSIQNVSCCHLCNEKCDQEVNALSDGGFAASVSDYCESNLPSWLQMTEFSTHNELDIVKAKDDRVLLSTKIVGVRRKWDNICQHLHHKQHSPKANNCQLGSQAPSVAGLQTLENAKANVNTDSRSETSASLTERGSNNINSMMSRDMQKTANSKPSSPTNSLSKANSLNLLFKYDEFHSKLNEERGLGSPFNSSNSSVVDGLTSPTCVTSVTVDLKLELNTTCTSSELEKPTYENHVGLLQKSSCCLPANPQVFHRSVSSNQAISSSCTQTTINGQFDQKDFKMLYTALVEKIGRQDEAVKLVSQTVVRCRTINERHRRANRADIWFNFLGPDRLGKKELAMALAEILHGSRENLIHVDLNFQEKKVESHAVFDIEAWNSFDVNYRGKNVVDYIAEKLSKNPMSLVFLESIDKADLLVQNSLTQALKTGRFLDSHGREIGIGNAIFVTTSWFIDGEKPLYSETADYSEEDILAVKGWPIHMIIGFDLCDDFVNMNPSRSDTTRKCSSNRIFMNKRKLISNNETAEHSGNMEVAKRAHMASFTDLDLNFPAEEGEICDNCAGNSECDSIYENSKIWLEEFSGQVDATVVFQPFDFDALAQKILHYISECFQKTVRSECSLEIDSRVMMQMVAAACLINHNKVEDWVQRVLSSGFEEAQEKYCLTARSTLKLVACEGTFLEEQKPTEFLPSRIIVN